MCFAVCAFVNRERCNNSIYLVYMCACACVRVCVRGCINENGAKNSSKKYF